MIKKIFFVALALFAEATFGQLAGTLDATFGTNGKALIDMTGNIDGANDTVVQPDGKIIIVGNSFTSVANSSDFAISRLNSNGTLDTSFGIGGKLNLNILNSENAQKVLLSSDGKIYVAGTSNLNGSENFTIIRLNNDGSYDTNYGTNGKVAISFPGSNFFENMSFQNDGKLLVCGYNVLNASGNYSDFAIARINLDGTLDFDFSNDGRVTLNIRNEDKSASILEDATGAIFVVGSGSSQACIARFFSDGTLDTAFGAAGKINISIAGLNTTIYDAKLQADGKIVVTGYSYNSASGGFNSLLARFLSNGLLDTSFGTNGYAIKDIDNASEDQNNALVLQPDGKIITCGRVYTGGNYFFSVLRHNSSGILDTTFSNDGIVLTAFGTSASFANGLALQPDGKLVVVGYYDQLNRDFAIARYHTGSSLSNEIFEKNELSLYPNPVKDSFTLNSNDFFENDYTIFDLFGKKVKVGVIISDQKMDIDNLNDGIYFLQVAKKTIKFIKNNQ